MLYNFARARKAQQKDGTVIAVEGYMDVIALAQAGFENAVAPLGTALTENQLELLWRMTDEPVLCFDGDQAGLKAAWRAADLALPMIGPGRTVRFALLPEGKDPDDLVRDGGAAAFAGVLAEARPLADLLWQRETSGGMFDTPEKRAELEKTLRELTSRIRDESLRYHYAQEMRSRAQAFRASDAGGKGTDRAQRSGNAARHGAAAGRLAVSESLARSALVRRAGGVMPLRESAILVMLANHPTLAEENFEAVEALDLGHAELRRAACGADRYAGQRPRRRPDRRGGGFPGCRPGGCVAASSRALPRRARLWPALEDAALDDAREAFAQALHLHRSARTLHMELKAAEAALANDPTDENYRQMLRHPGATSRSACDGRVDRRVRDPLRSSEPLIGAHLIRFFGRIVPEPLDEPSE